MNIGAGRVVEQILRRIDRCLLEEQPADIACWRDSLHELKSRGARLHLFGLISNGRVHSCHRHLISLAHSAIQAGVAACIHAIGDGRDCPPQSLIHFLDEVASAVPTAQLCTLIGRYYALDRNQRWARTKSAWQLLQLGHGAETPDWKAAIQDCYAQGLSDEFLPAMRCDPTYHGFAAGDILMCCNYRTDRIRQIVHALHDPNFDAFARDEAMSLARILSIVPYGSNLTTSLFAREEIRETLGQIIASAGLTQVRIAETEKFPHVTYFFNGGRETASPSEEHRLIPSPQVASYDLAPEMSAAGITDHVLAVLKQKADLVVVNYANPDMVGHTGDIAATIAAIETVDQQLGRLLPSVRDHGYSLLVTADHGNAEMLWDAEHKMPHTAHTNNPVRLIGVDAQRPFPTLHDGVLGDIAPTILARMELSVPVAMTGRNLMSADS